MQSRHQRCILRHLLRVLPVLIGAANRVQPRVMLYQVMLLCACSAGPRVTARMLLEPKTVIGSVKVTATGQGLAREGDAVVHEAQARETSQHTLVRKISQMRVPGSAAWSDGQHGHSICTHCKLAILPTSPCRSAAASTDMHVHAWSRKSELRAGDQARLQSLQPWRSRVRVVHLSRWWWRCYLHWQLQAPRSSVAAPDAAAPDGHLAVTTQTTARECTGGHGARTALRHVRGSAL